MRRLPAALPLLLVLGLAACSSGGAAASSPGAVTTLRASESVVLGAAESVAPQLREAAQWQARVRAGEQRLPAVQAAAAALTPSVESLRVLLRDAAVSASFVDHVASLRSASDSLAAAGAALASCVSTCAEHLADASAAAADAVATVDELHALLR